MSIHSTAEPTYRAFEKAGIDPPFVQLFAAPRKSGKTYLIRNLLLTAWKKMFDYILIVSPSLKYNNDYEDVEKALRPHTEVTFVKENFENIVKGAIQQQKQAFELHKKFPEEYDEVHTLIILDDCIDENLFAFRNSSNVADEVATRGRHYGLSLVLSTQTLRACSPYTRRNAEALYVFSPMNYTDFEAVLNEYVPRKFQSKFRDLMEQAFETEYSFILIDGSQKRRQNFKQRIRKGFNELLFADGTKDHLQEKPKIKPSKKRAASSQKVSSETKRSREEQNDLQ